MERTSHPHQPQPQWWPSPSALDVLAAGGDTDRHWDAIVRLLALGDDEPVPPELERYDGMGSEEDENDHDGGAIFQPHSFRCEPLVGPVGDKRDADYRLSASLSEDDIAFIVSSTSEDGIAEGRSSDSITPLEAANATTTIGIKAALTTVTSPPAPEVMSSAEEARRERNRLKVRRLYYRKLDRLNGLRSEVTDLEDQLESLKLVTSSSSNSTQEPATVEPSKLSVDYATLLQQLAQTKQQLQHENEYLRRVVSQYIRSVHAVSVKLLALREPPSAYLNIKSVTRLECSDLRRRTLTEVRNFARSRHLFEDMGCICGWQSANIIQDGIFRFNVEKIVSGYSADEVAALSWNVLCDPLQLARVHSTAMDMKCYVLQEIDDDNLVIFHEHRAMNPSEERTMVVRIILLLSRVKTVSGHVLTLTSLDRDKWVLEDHSPSQLQDTVVWNDLFCWLQYRDNDAGGCVCTFAGFSPIISINVDFWMIELVQLAVRWESMTLGPEAYSLKSTPPDPSTHAGVEC